MKFKKRFLMDSSLCRNGIADYRSIFKIMMETSDAHSGYARATTADLQKKGYTWMIYKWRVNFDKMPRENEEVSVFTWASDFKRLNACREFEIYNEDNERIIYASAVFLVVDLDRRKPVRIPGSLADKFSIEPSKNFEKIDRIEKTGEFFCSNKPEIRQIDIDINGHVNNTVYINWLVNSLPEDFTDSHEIKSLNLIYNREILSDDDVSVMNYKDGNKIYSEIESDEINAKSEIIWKIKVD